MSSIKTFAGVAVVVGAVVFGAKAQRESTVEADRAVRQMVESSVRMNAAGFNPQVDLTARELKGFDIVGVKITRPRISAMIDSAGGGDRSYEVYVRFREDGGEKCMTLALKWGQGDGSLERLPPGRRGSLRAPVVSLRGERRAPPVSSHFEVDRRNFTGEKI